jgi:CHAD domain-containing protein
LRLQPRAALRHTLHVVIKKKKPAHPGKPAFHLKKSESVAGGFSRAIAEQLQAASEHLHSGAEPLDESVHEARKALKRSRALLRLVRPAIGGAYRVFNAELRDVGRGLSQLRDTQALADTLDSLKRSSLRNPANRLLEETHGRLLKRKQQIVQDFTKREESARMAKALDQIKTRIASVPSDQATNVTVVTAIAQTVRRGRKAFARAQQSGCAEDFHEWRKRTKDLRYQMDFLEHLWPHVLAGYSESARDLEQCLGEDHNLSVLSDMLHATENVQKQKDAPLLAIFDEEQRRLRKQAEDIGRLLYAEKPKHWARRMEFCFDGR